MNRMVKPVKGFPAYEVSSEGEVFSHWRKNGRNWVIDPEARTLVGHKVGNGAYHRVELHDATGTYLYQVHRLVLLTFVGPCPSGKQARHLNGNSHDNRLENLIWGTPLANAADRARHGHSMIGETNPNHKLTDDDVVALRADPRSDAEAALAYGLTRSHVNKIRRGERWSHIPLTQGAT